ncbi:YopX family protein [Macrococcoides caseolyticum]|uniref:YopX family protein n=1 Tax=Macrococcoides caseolyticum TaxID=69966 RepID=UPI0024BC7055|nr:YopX family protein [Macrococcus caseolyticus]MDJ1088038.1 YopX family protein [Macrococcus caseolyticus]
MITKFRAWDKEKKIMDIVGGITFDGNEIWEISFPGDCWIDASNYILMQSTGLHDVNGKEIFEGDVLHHPLQGMRKVYYPFNDRVASYGLENIENGVRSTLQDSHRVYEIIGNIHENPELLEKEDGE